MEEHELVLLIQSTVFVIHYLPIEDAQIVASSAVLAPGLPLLVCYSLREGKTLGLRVLLNEALGVHFRCLLLLINHLLHLVLVKERVLAVIPILAE